MKPRSLILSQLSADDRDRLTRRSAVPDAAIREGAAAIIAEIRDGGDRALSEAGRRYGGALAGRGFRVSPDAIAAAAERTPPAVRSALAEAHRAIADVHRAQVPVDHAVEPTPGVVVERRWSPLRRIAAYVPGGGAAYPSSLLMGAVPARVAGVREVVVATPADAGGEVPDVVLAAAQEVGVTEVYAMGGAQAVAALAYGTESIERVDKIVGPGNAWVTAAKLAVIGDTAVDLPAGPSEAVVVSDGSASPDLVAADVICQAEHGPDTPVVLVTTDPEEPAAVLAAIDVFLEHLGRSTMIRKALDDHGLIVIADDVGDALKLADDFAPEHLSLLTKDAADHAGKVTAAGSVFVGPWSPESAGDYATGANHILPTGGQARGYGPLGVEDFGSWRQVQSLTRDGLAALRGTITTLAGAEGFGAHRLAAEVRFREGLSE